MKRLMKITIGAASLAASLAAFAATPAFAIDGLSANAAFTTDYVWRGFSQSASKPAVSGGLDYSIGSTGLAVGTWVSSINFGDNSPIEWDLYGGYSGNITDQFSYSAGMIGYIYPDSPAGTDYNFYELHGGLGYNLGFASVSGDIYYSPDIFGTSNESSEYYSFGVNVPVVDWLSASGHFGVYDFSGSTSDYDDWSFGLAATYEAYKLALSYNGVDATGAPDTYVATLSFSL